MDISFDVLTPLGFVFEHLSPEDKDILIQASREVSLDKIKPS
jgi:hypothetical protein